MKGSRTPQGSQGHWYVCSDLVLIRPQRPGIIEEAVPAVLEEIGPEGAVVQLENEVEPGTSLRLDCQGAQFDGVVGQCEKEPNLGYFAKLIFNRGQHWCVDLFRPRHLLDIAIAGPHNPGHDHKDFARKGRWEDSMPAADTPPEAVSETIRRVAQNTAVVCGEMDLIDMAHCFSRFFQSAPQGVLFGRFVRTYRNTRETLTGIYELPVSPMRQACEIAMLLGGLPQETMRTAAPVGL